MKENICMQGEKRMKEESYNNSANSDIRDMQYKPLNPITKLDYPDPDVIRVEDTYYMASTTMHFMPGCEILRSYDLCNWEHLTYVYDRLDSTPAQRLEGEENVYGKGMWATTLRYHKGRFYICFVANDTGKTYLYTADNITEPWNKSTIEGFFHDCSLLFDDDDRVYIVYGNREIYLTELNEELTASKEGGLHRMIIKDSDETTLGYEGAHFYKINGKYYIFLIHSLIGEWRRTEACFVADSLDGEFKGCDVVNDDIGYCYQGVAQGGIVDTPDGKWYGILFQDRGAVGRIPVLVPVKWENEFPVFGENGKIPDKFPLATTRPGYEYTPLVASDDFKVPEKITKEEKDRIYGSFGLKSVWQFNHEPDLSLVKHDCNGGRVEIQTGKLCQNVTQSKNMLTQRMLYPGCEGEVTVDISGLKDGDYAGLCALQGCYGFVGVTKRDGQAYIVMVNKEADGSDMNTFPNDKVQGKEWEAIPVTEDKFRLKVAVDFTDMKDEAEFFYYDKEKNGYRKVGNTHKLYFKLDHFTGCRFGLFVYSTKETGGVAGFENFIYKKE